MSRCSDGKCGACDGCVPNLEQEKIDEDRQEERWEIYRQREIDSGVSDETL
jgi:hypothetical protein